MHEPIVQRSAKQRRPQQGSGPWGAALASLLLLAGLLGSSRADAFEFDLLVGSRILVDIGTSTPQGTYAVQSFSLIETGQVGSVKTFTLPGISIPDTVSQLGVKFQFRFGNPGQLSPTADLTLHWDTATGQMWSDVFRVRVQRTDSFFPENYHDVMLTSFGDDLPPPSGIGIENYDPVEDEFRCGTNKLDGFNPMGEDTPLPFPLTGGDVYLIASACPVVEAGIPLELPGIFITLELRAHLSDPPNCSSSGGDADSDFICQDFDNCTDAFNSDQRDTNSDGYGNHCDCDFDNDGICGVLDFTAFAAVFTLTGPPDYDMDGDGVVGIIDFTLFSSGFSDPPGPSGLGCAGTIPCP